jgi:tRNA-specific 2-thiouridylase
MRTIDNKKKLNPDHREATDRLRPPVPDEAASANEGSITEKLQGMCQLTVNASVKSVPAGKVRVAVAMSGGVDSSTCALLLKQLGYDVVGVTGWLIKSGSRCCDTGMIDAARVCEQLEVEHHAVDLREMFKNEIVDQFHQSYAQGRTPLPCSLCNTLIKWGALYNYGKKLLNASYLATGHYARIVRGENGSRLARAVDATKDQSYVLWGLTAEQLDSTLLPLGDYSKQQIRAIASEHGLASANRPDSQDLCFIPKGQTPQSYLANFLAEAPGPVIHTVTGKVLGEHKGTHNFTIGQRKGLGIASSEILYVTCVDPEKQVVYVGPKESLFRRRLTASAANWISQDPPDEPFEALAKVRYNSPTAAARITPLDGNRIEVTFHEPQPAIAPGQVLGVYDPSDTYILGGGWID